MNSAAAPHPSPDCLRLFGTGQLSGDEAAGVETHVSDCPECCDALRSVADDSFAALVRRATSARPAWPSGDTTPQLSSGPPGEACAESTFPEVSRAAPAVVEVPAELREHPRYRILELLGHGGMGAVYKAEHRLMRRTVALKLISRDLTRRPGVAERFVRETQTAGRLAHPNIAQAYDAEQAGDTLFLVMEFVPGTDLARLVRERGPLPCAEACRHIRQAALALQHAHERGMVHRDIKPHNLMLTPGGEIKVLDFGLARFVAEQPPTDTSHLTEDGLFMGTADYVAPEQARDAHRADIRADVYSLGCTLYHLLTGQVPFPAGTVMDKAIKHATERPPALSVLRPELPTDLEVVVMKMLAKQPSQRYQMPGEVGEALAPFTLEGVVALPTVQPARSGSPGPLAEEGLVREPAVSFSQTTVLPARLAGAGRTGRGWWRRPAAVAAGLLFVAAALAGMVVYRIQTDKGELVIETVDDDIEVVVKDGGKVVTIYDPKSGQKLALRSGTYELELKGKPTGLKLDLDRVTLKRGDVKVATIERVRAAPPPAAPTFTPMHRIRGSSGFNHLNVSPDGRYLCAVRSGQNISVWDTRSGKRVFERKKGALARFSADSTQLITCETFSDLNVYDLDTGRLVRSFDTGEHMYYFSAPARDRLVYQTPRGKQVWDWVARKKLCDLPSDNVVWLTPDGLHAFQHSGEKPHLRVLDASTGKEAGAYPKLRGLPHGPISSDGKRILDWEGSKVTEYDVATGKEIQTADVGLDRRVAYSGNYRRLLTYGKARDELRLLDVQTGKLLAVLRFPEPVAPDWGTGYLSDDGQVVGVIGPTDSIYIFRLPDPPQARIEPKAVPGQAVEVFRQRREGGGNTTGLSLSPDGRLLLWSNYGGVRIYDVKANKLFHENLDCWAGRFTPDAKMYVAAGGDTRRVYDTESGKLVRKFGPPITPGDYSGGAFIMCPDGRSVYVGGVLWDYTTGQEVRRKNEDDPDFDRRFWGDSAIAQFSRRTKIVVDYVLPDGREVMGRQRAEGDALAIYDVRSDKLVRKIPVGGSGPVCSNASDYGARFGRRMAVSRVDGTISVVDLVSGEVVARLSAGNFTPKCLAMSADDRFVAACALNENSDVVVWRLPDPPATRDDR